MSVLDEAEQDRAGWAAGTRRRRLVVVLFAGSLLSACSGSTPPATYVPSPLPPTSPQSLPPVAQEPSAIDAEEAPLDEYEDDFADGEAEAEESLRQERLAERQEHLAAFLAIAVPLDASLAEPATRWAGIDDPRLRFSVREYRGATTVSFRDGTQEAGSAWAETRTVFRAGRQALEIRLHGDDESYVQTLELDPLLNARSRRDVGAAFGTRILRRPHQRLFGLAMLFTSVRPQPATHQDTGFSIVGPLYEPGSRPARFPLPAGEGGMTNAMLVEQPGGVVHVSPVYQSCGRMTAGRNMLMRCQLAGRKGGAAFALRRLNENDWHWVLETRLATQGWRVEWAGEHGGYIFGHYGGQPPAQRRRPAAGLIAIRLHDGAAFRIDVPGVYENGREVENLAEDARRRQEHQGCLEAAAAARRVEVNRLRPSDYQGCAQARWDTLTLEEDALLVGRHDGSVARIPFDRLQRALR